MIVAILLTFGILIAFIPFIIKDSIESDKAYPDDPVSMSFEGFKFDNNWEFRKMDNDDWLNEHHKSGGLNSYFLASGDLVDAVAFSD